jgi:hypothetical protein
MGYCLGHDVGVAGVHRPLESRAGSLSVPLPCQEQPQAERRPGRIICIASQRVSRSWQVVSTSMASSA